MNCLKRVLSIALMSAMLAVNFMIPALAADYTINYNDLPESLKNRQNELYYETTPGSSATGSGLDSTVNNLVQYAPLDVWKQTARQAVNMKASEWIRYEADVAEAGYYQVDLFAGVNVAAGVDYVVRTDSHITEAHLNRTSNLYVAPDAVNMGYLYLNKGSNYIYVENRDPVGQANFNKIELTKDDTADETSVKALNLVTTCNEAETATFTTAEGYTTIELNGGEITFPLSITQAGKYKVYLHGKTETGSSATITVGETSKDVTIEKTEKTPASTTYLTYDNTDGLVFPLTAGEHTLSVSGLEDYKLAWVVVEYEAPYGTALETGSFEQGAEVARGTDHLVLTFNDVMDPQADITVTLEGTNKTIPTDVAVDDNTVVISFLETLDYSDSYTLTVSGLKGANDEKELGELTYPFTTGTEAEDAGVESLSDVSVTTSYETGNVKGVVLGSQGQGIKGRKVTVVGSTGNTFVGMSGENGEFSIPFIILETDVGTYSYTVTSEYGTEETISVTYVSAEKELEILDSFQYAETAADVEAILESNVIILGIPNYLSDAEVLNDSATFKEGAYNRFHLHFAGKAFASISEFLPFYEKMLLLEKMNSAKLGSYLRANFLTKPEVYEKIFPDYIVEKLNVIYLNSNGLSQLETNLIQNTPAESEIEFYEMVNNLLDSYFGVGNVNLIGKNELNELPIGIGGEPIIIPITVDKDKVGVTEIQLLLSASDPAIFAQMYYIPVDASLDENGNAYFEDGILEQAQQLKKKLSVKGKTATVTYSGTFSGTFDGQTNTFGCLVFEPVIYRKYNLTVSGDITQTITESFTDTSSIAPCQITIDTGRVSGSCSGANSYGEAYGFDWEILGGTLYIENTLSGSGRLGYDYYSSSFPYKKYAVGIIKIVLNGIGNVGYGAFQNYPNLEEVEIELTGYPLVISDYAFYGCQNLKTVILPEYTRSIGNAAFAYCDKWQTINMPDSITNIGSYAFCYCSSLREIHIPGNLTSISTETFYQCESLTEVEIPESVTVINNRAFCRCFSLEKITLPKQLEIIGGNAFTGCNISSLVIPDYVTSIGTYAFSICANLQSVVIGSSVEQMGSGIFVDCDNLKSITVKDGVCTIGEFAFADTTGLTQITLPETLTKIEHGAFACCENLENIVIPNSVCEVEYQAFDRCVNLKSVTLGNGITSLTQEMFIGCSSLQEIVIPNTVDIIGRHVFDGCNSLTTVSIPSSVTAICENAFLYCSALSDVYYDGTQEEWNEIYIGEGNEALLNATIHFVTRLVYDANGGENAPDVVYQSGEVQISEQVPTRFGYVFKGWTTQQHSLSVEYQPTDVISLEDGSVTLYAVWHPVEVSARLYDEELFVTVANVPEGSQIVVACYQGETLSFVTGAVTTAENAYYIPLESSTYDKVKVMLYDSFLTMKPLYYPVEITSEEL